ATALLRLKAANVHPPNAPTELGWLDDAIDEAVFVDQRDIEKSEQKHFERAIGQLERFVQDKVLLYRRELSSVIDKLTSLRARRDAVVGSSAREKIEQDMTTLDARRENLEQRINALDSREDEVYKKWREKYHELRYRPPVVIPLFEVSFQISRQIAGTSC